MDLNYKPAKIIEFGFSSTKKSYNAPSHLMVEYAACEGIARLFVKVETAEWVSLHK